MAFENPWLRFSNPGSGLGPPLGPAQTKGARGAGIGLEAMVVVTVQILLAR